MRPDIHLQIDRLVLDGLPIDGIDPGALAEDVRAALQGLLADQGIHEGLASGGARNAIRGGTIQHPEPSVQGLGRQIAQAIHAGLTGNEAGVPSPHPNEARRPTTLWGTSGWSGTSGSQTPEGLR